MYGDFEKVLEEEVRPYLKEHHGDIEIVDFKEGVLKVRFLGGCSGCLSAQFTLEDLVEKELKKRFEYIDSVVLADDEISEEMLDFVKELLRKNRNRERPE